MLYVGCSNQLQPRKHQLWPTQETNSVGIWQPASEIRQSTMLNIEPPKGAHCRKNHKEKREDYEAAGWKKKEPYTISEALKDLTKI